MSFSPPVPLAVSEQRGMADSAVEDPQVVVAVGSHKPKGDNQLPFKKGDVIHVSRFGEDAQQAYGSLNGKQGWFPLSLVSTRTDVRESKDKKQKGKDKTKRRLGHFFKSRPKHEELVQKNILQSDNQSGVPLLSQN